MSEQDLWSAVVLQACHDLDQEHSSAIYSDALAFFTAAGEWANARQSVADHLGLHVEDIKRLGRSLLAARHDQDRRNAALSDEMPAEDPLSVPAGSQPGPAPCPPSPEPGALRAGPRLVALRRDRTFYIQRFFDKQRR